MLFHALLHPSSSSGRRTRSATHQRVRQLRSGSTLGNPAVRLAQPNRNTLFLESWGLETSLSRSRTSGGSRGRAFLPSCPLHTVRSLPLAQHDTPLDTHPFPPLCCPQPDGLPQHACFCCTALLEGSKVNPVVPEFAMQSCTTAIRSELACGGAAEHAQVDLNGWEGSFVHSLSTALELVIESLCCFGAFWPSGVGIKEEESRKKPVSSRARARAYPRCSSYTAARETERSLAKPFLAAESRGVENGDE